MFNLELSEHLTPITIYISTFVSLFLNGATNLPSSQFIYLALGYLINVRDFNFYFAVILGAVANTLGNFVLYKIIMNNSDFLNSKLAKFLNLDPVRLDKYNNYFKHRWWGWLILCKMTPSVKVLVPIICGLSRIPTKRTITIFFLGSILWASIVTYLGYYFGKEASLLQFYIIVTCIYVFIGSFSYLKIHFKQNKE